MRFALVAVFGALLGSGLTLGWVRLEGDHFAQQWRALFDLPAGEFAYVPDPPTIVQKTAPRTLAYRPLPTPDQVHVTQLFAPESTEPPTTTTLPPKETHR